MPTPRPLNLLRQLHQRAVTGTDVLVDGVLRENETLVAPGRLVEEEGERGVVLFRLPPDVEVVHGFLDGWRGALDFLLGLGGPGDGFDGGGFAFLVGCPGELACFYFTPQWLCKLKVSLGGERGRHT